MPKAVERGALDAALVLGPAPVGQPLMALLETQMVMSGKRLVLQIRTLEARSSS